MSSVVSARFPLAVLPSWLEKKSWRADSNRGPADYEWWEGHTHPNESLKGADRICVHRFATWGGL
jgi:hypothetical protein